MASVLQSVGGHTAGAQANIQLALPGNVAANSVILVGVINYDIASSHQLTPAHFSDTRSGVYASVPTSRYADANQEMQFWWARVPSAGAFTLTITPPVSEWFAVVVWEVSLSASTATPTFVGSYGSGTGTAIATGNLVTTEDAIILGVATQVSAAATIALTPDATKYTEDQHDYDGDGYYPYSGCHRTTVPIGAGTYTVTWVAASSVGWRCTAVAISDAPATLTGTAAAGITEADIVTGGKTIILTLTGDTFIAA